MITRCRHEDDVRQAAVSGRWPADLDAHADGCDACREVRLVASLLNTAPAQPPRDV